MPDFFNVGKVNAVLVNADPTNQKKITNGRGGKLYYKTTSAVSTSDSFLEPGESLTIEQVYWTISNTECSVTIEPRLGNVVANTAGTITSSALAGFYGGGWNPAAATSGTDTTPAEKKLFVTSLFLPANKTIKGIGYLVGSVGGTNKAVAGLWNSAGTLLAHSSETTEGTLVGTAAEKQELPLTAEYKAVGPGMYFIGVTMNGNTARLRCIPKNTAGENVLSEEITLAAKNVLANITAPTAFKEDKGPIGWIY